MEGGESEICKMEWNVQEEKSESERKRLGKGRGIESA